jgi:Na+-translocating ferredoxin:NAD+ oxidoreductase subunit B
MSDDIEIFRKLQQHLDLQAVAFPSSKSGADLRLLQRLFTAEEAQLALHLSYKPIPIAEIIEHAAAEFSAEQVGSLLESMLQKGSLGWKAKEGIDCWHLLPLWLGIFEAQDGHLSPEFLADAEGYMQTLEYRMSLYSIKPSQMRTIPINRSVTAKNHVGRYDQIQALIESASGPFVVLNCTCRQTAAMKDKPCKQTKREETCLLVNHMAANALRRGHGREIPREEALAILEQNQEDGLVLQLSNAQEPEFICSCCGCCCAWLRVQKSLPRPAEYWTSNYFAEIDSEACVSCGDCVARCQVNAISLPENSTAAIDLRRCIGCGLCIMSCPATAISLKEKASEIIPPKTREELDDLIRQNRKFRKPGNAR